MRSRKPWIPVLLSTLALLTVVGGIALGHYYWTGLRASMGQMASSMSQARERQRDLLIQLDRTQALMAAQQGQLRAEAEALKRREEALAAARRQLAAEREDQTEERGRCELRRERATDALRLAEAARLVDTALARLSAQNGAATASDALSAAGLLLEGLDSPHEADLRRRLAAVQTRLDRLEPEGKAALKTQLDALRARAAKLKVDFREIHSARGRPSRAELDSAARSLRLQLDTADFALDRADGDLFVQALDTASVWLETFFDTRRPETRRVAREIELLAAHPPELDLGDSVAELDALSADLRAGADGIRPSDLPDSSPM